jgi:hypothetical protein
MVCYIFKLVNILNLNLERLEPIWLKLNADWLKARQKPWISPSNMYPDTQITNQICQHIKMSKQN